MIIEMRYQCEACNILRVTLLALIVLFASGVEAAPGLSLERVPDHGIQPRLFTDNMGLMHLVYFKPVDSSGRGPALGNLYYRYRLSNESWSDAELVSGFFRHGDAVRKASVAAGDAGSIHVVWLRSDEAPEYFYSRRIDNGFETPRSVVKNNLGGVETEASIAVQENQVSIVWHAGSMRRESSRQVFQVLSVDRGVTFGDEIAISDQRLGACACCGLVSSLRNDEFLVAYRSAVNDSGRHMQLLRSNGGWHTQTVSEWSLTTCPVSSNSLAGDWLVFETRGTLFKFDVRKDVLSIPLSPKGDAGRQKHPSIAIGDQGEQLITWGEGPGYFDGGILNLQLLSVEGTLLPTPDTSAMEIPKYSVAAAGYSPKSGFVVLY
jgi:hypothetical protein